MALEQVSSLIGVSTQTAHNRLEIWHTNVALPLLIKHLEDALEVLYFFLRILAKYVFYKSTPVIMNCSYIEPLELDFPGQLHLCSPDGGSVY